MFWRRQKQGSEISRGCGRSVSGIRSSMTLMRSGNQLLTTVAGYKYMHMTLGLHISVYSDKREKKGTIRRAREFKIKIKS